VRGEEDGQNRMDTDKGQKTRKGRREGEKKGLCSYL
jgi:hypothetical protein